MKPNAVTHSGGYVKFIAYLQVIGIILVVAGHSLHEYPDGVNGQSTLFYRAFLTFRMPLFMFVSGFLMVYATKVTGNKSKHTPRSFMVNKVKRLLLPFVVLTLVTLFPRSLMDSMADDTMPVTLETFVLAFVDYRYMPIPFYWFLQASFIMLVLTFTMLYYSKVCNVSQRGVIVFLLAAFLILLLVPLPLPEAFAVNRIKYLGFFFVLGCAFCMFANEIAALHVPWTKWWFMALCVVLWGIMFRYSSDFKPMGVVCSMAGIAACISFAMILEEKNITFLDHLTGANYIIFLLSWYFNIASQQILAHFVKLPWWVYSVLSLISGIYIPWLGYKYLERHRNSRWVKVTAFLLGQSFRKKNGK